MASYIWIPDEKAVWAAALVLEANKKGKSIRVQTKDGKEKKLDGPITDYDAVTQEDLSRECENLLDLDSVTEGLVLHHVRERFARGTIYTNVGAILVAANPYRTLDIYDEACMLNLWKQVASNGIDASGKQVSITPHAFGIGAQALNDMRESSRSQSILISGESGAGKTETTKKILQFLSSMAAYAAAGASGPVTTDHGDESIAAQILGTNPILESFGNAKTIKNNNSSRFGKYMEIKFTAAPTYAICGTAIKTYLLEKNRVIAPGKNERNYHIFYMLLAGASKDMQKEFALGTQRDAMEWSYLNGTGCVQVGGRVEKQEYIDLIGAFARLKFGDDVIKQIFQILSAILHVGNVTFVADGEGSRVANPEKLATVAYLLGISQASRLEECFCAKEIVVNKEKTLSKLNVMRAQEQRDAFARFMYGSVFDALVLQINKVLAGDEKLTSSSTCNIGILDIFGFEVFAVNSFEQLCINYCNERLQTFFNEIVFEKEIEIYKQEHLDLADITFVNNHGCVKIIDGSKGSGIFSLLDEECSVPQGSDAKLLSKMTTAFTAEKSSNHSNYFVAGGRKGPNDFAVKHFAGEVTYNISNFCEKNKDTLNPATLTVASSTSLPIVNNAASVALGTDDESEVRSSKKGSSGKLTISHKFKLNLDELMITLRSKQPWFVRCIKPNDQAKPDKFDGPLVLSQMKYSGLFEAIKIRKSGFPVRISTQAFFYKYRCLLPMSQWEEVGIEKKRGEMLNKVSKEKDSSKSSSKSKEKAEDIDAYYRAQTKLLLKALEKAFSETGKDAMLSEVEQKMAADFFCNNKSKPKNWTLGDTRVFLRSTHTQSLLESRLTKVVIPRAVVVIMMRTKKWLALGRDIRKREAAKRAAEEDKRIRDLELSHMNTAEEESILENVQFRQGLEKVRKAAEAKKRELEEKVREELRRKVKAVVRIQAWLRGRAGRKVGQTYMCEIRFERALQDRNETALYQAMKKTESLGVKSKALSRYKKSASSVILDVLSESHIVAQLQEAIRSDSDVLLAAAIAAAEDSRMAFLPQVKTARQLLVSHQDLKAGLAWLERELELANTVPRLLQSVDYMRRLIQEASTKSLHNEPVCQDALFRIGKMRNLLVIRDEMRFACETASISAMKSALQSRAKVVPIFGETIFQEEVTAISNMQRMLALLPQLSAAREAGEDEAKFAEEEDSASSDDDEPEDSPPESDAEGDVGDAGASSIEASPKGKIRSLATQEQLERRVLKAERAERRAQRDEWKTEREHIRKLEESTPLTDVRLPAWLRELFLIKKKAQAQATPQQVAAYNAVCNKIQRLCPIPRVLEQYNRVFKWTVAFCTWMPDHPRHDREKHPFASTQLGSGATQGEFAPPPEEEDPELIALSLGVTGITGSMAAMSIRKKGSKLVPPPTTARVLEGKTSNPVDVTTGKDKYGRSAAKVSAIVSVLGTRGDGPGHAFAPPTYKETHSRVNLNPVGGKKSSTNTATHRQRLSEADKPAYMGSTGMGRRLKSDLLRDKVIKSGKEGQTRVGASADEIIQDAIRGLGSIQANSRARHGTAWM